MVAPYYAEKDPAAIQVATVQSPWSVFLGSVQDVTEEIIFTVGNSHSGALFFVLGRPPCQDVSLVNSSRIGSYGVNSGLRSEYERIYRLFEYYAPPGHTLGLMECTRMDATDRAAYDSVFKCPPVGLCSRHFSPTTRPRSRWASDPSCFEALPSRWSSVSQCQEIIPCDVERVPTSQILLPGWEPFALSTLSDSREVRDDFNFNFRCLTTRESRSKPSFKPRGIRSASPGALRRWSEDSYSQALYQFAASNCARVPDGRQPIRRLLPVEEEVLMGYPGHYTYPVAASFHKEDHPGISHKKQSLLGNAWHIGVVKYIFTFLLIPLVRVNSSEVGSSRGRAMSRIHPELTRVYEDLRGACPYLTDRAERGLECGMLLGPDRAE